MIKPVETFEQIRQFIKLEKAKCIVFAISILVFAALSILAAYYGMTAAPSSLQKAVYLLSAFGCALSMVGVPISFMIIAAVIGHKTPAPEEKEEFYTEL